MKPLTEYSTTHLLSALTVLVLLFKTPIDSIALAQGNSELAEQLSAERPIRAGSSYWLEELTWMEIRDLISNGTNIVIVPTGGIEENGPYLAIGKHNLILEAICPAIAEKLGNALCAPIVKFVPEGSIEPPDGAMLFPGTISLGQATFEALLTDIAASMKQAGFADIVFIGDSGGNQHGMSNVADKLNTRWTLQGPKVHFVRQFYDPGWEETEKFSERVLGISESTSDGYHDDIWVTAMMTVIDPDQVRYRQRVEADLASINGVSIQPLEETMALGRALVEYRAEYTARAIRIAVGN